jgi:hypothetical protein
MDVDGRRLEHQAFGHVGIILVLLKSIPQSLCIHVDREEPLGEVARTPVRL